MNYWWVNHKQTYRQEISGGYMWSPKRESHGNRSQYYEFMREARPGDLVISYADAEIKKIGIVSGFPLSAPKPDEFGAAGKNWSEEGWYVPVTWSPVPTAFRPKDHIERIRPLLPDKYSPIQDNGNGNQKAYLTKISWALAQVLADLGEFNPNPSLPSDDFVDAQDLIDAIEDDLEKSIENDQSLDDTERKAIIRARKGQGKFRANVEKIEQCCRVSRLKDKRLLIASHIKPWRMCETALERLDGSNGLLLAPHIDKLFDTGLITFEKSGELLTSTSLDDETLECLHLGKALQIGVGAFSTVQETYLQYHRKEIFLT